MEAIVAVLRSSAATMLYQPTLEEQAMLDAFDAALTTFAYAGAGLCLFAIVWAGFLLMADGTDERGGGRAKGAVVLAVVGLVLTLSAKGIAALLRSGLVDFPIP